MRLHKVLIVMTAANLVLLAWLLSQLSPAQAQATAPIVRAQALEIVDQQGRVRASLNIQPASRHDGQHYPETVLLRLIDPTASRL